MSEAQTQTRQRRLWMTALVVCSAAFLSVFYFFDPTQHGFFPRCWLHETTGLHCPGCGGQRALHALLNGDVARAFGHNFFVMCALPLVAWYFGRKLWWRIRKLPPRLPQDRPPALLWTFVACVIAFGFLRNLPMGPFSHLAP